MPVESGSSKGASDKGGLQLRLLGPLVLMRDGLEVAMPASRKVRALLGYLALAPNAVARSHLCELFWDVPNDPRGELRWCLSKIRALVDDPPKRRVLARSDRVSLDLSDCLVDAFSVSRAVQSGLDTLTHEEKRALSPQFRGELLEGLEIGRNAALAAWLTGQRRRFRGLEAALLEDLAANAPAGETLDYLEKLLQIAPFDRRAHEKVLIALAERGRIKDGEKHLEAATRSFEQEGLDSRSLLQTWKAARAKAQPAEVRTSRSHQPEPAAVSFEAPIAAARRASLAVMPFVDDAFGDGRRDGTTDALVHDVITRIAKLRNLFVIAQGTVFALGQKHMAPQDAGRLLNVDYIVSGSVRRRGNRISVSVELAEARTARIVWTDVLSPKFEDALVVLDEIGDRIVASVTSEIEAQERNRAILQPPASLDAWQAYHRGLWHMYRFEKADNELARKFFQMAVRLDPTFARAHAGLSFTHWQSAFQNWEDRAQESERAYAAASKSLMADDRDPAAHWAMGRALWLRGQVDGSVLELGQSVNLSPNFALAHYNLAFVHATSGNAAAAVASADLSRELSPFDPMLFGMLGARAMALVRLGRFEEAAKYGLEAAARPNAFTHIHCIAALSSELAGRTDAARVQLKAIRKVRADYRLDHFLKAFQFDDAGTKLFSKAAKRLGLP